MKFVFGMGIALVNHWDFIKEYYNPDYAVDNNPQKWDTTDSITGLLCKNPQIIGNYPDSEVLITIGDPYVVEQVKKQLGEYSITLHTLIDSIEKWGIDKGMPDNLLKTLNNSKKKVVLFNTPTHDNIGDHLITLSTIEMLEEVKNDYCLCEITDIEYQRYRKEIKKRVGKDDVILISGGGYLGSLWLYNGELNVRNIIEDYPYNKIIVLPQTVFFENNIRGQIELNNSKEIYNSNDKVIFCSRDKNSFYLLNQILNDKNVVKLFPDMAMFFSLKERYIPKERVLLCLREDKEQVVDGKKCAIMNVLTKYNEIVEETSMHTKKLIEVNTREKFVNDKLKELAEASLVITDTLHCMISAALVGTPCIAFDNISGKVSSVYEWLKELDYVYLCEDISEFEKVYLSIEKKQNSFELKDKKEYIRQILGLIKED